MLMLLFKAFAQKYTLLRPSNSVFFHKHKIAFKKKVMAKKLGAQRDQKNMDESC